MNLNAFFKLPVVRYLGAYLPFGVLQFMLWTLVWQRNSGFRCFMGMFLVYAVGMVFTRVVDRWVKRWAGMPLPEGDA